jgi:hypothetical protein
VGRRRDGQRDWGYRPISFLDLFELALMIFAIVVLVKDLRN